ncbi:MAG TPA: TonB C-terminal domain-containing protein [Rhodanobacteraceae bacterium]
MKAVASFALGIVCCCGLSGAALADEFAKQPIIHLVTSIPVAPPAPPSVAPPTYSDASDSYKCNMGNAISAGNDYRAFIKKYGVGQPDTARVPAWSNNMVNPDLPADAGKPAYVSVLVALKTDGRIENAIVECSTDAASNASVLKAVEATTFHPEMKDGQFVPSLERVEYWILRN